MDQKNIALSILNLNEYCLLDIFKFLTLADLVHLDKAWAQLKRIGGRVCAQKYKQIEVQINNNKGMKQKDFTNIMSVIGEHILSMTIDGANQLILQLIKDKCKNIKSIELLNCKTSIQLQCFENLKELKLNSVNISTNELKRFFARNAELECLEYDCLYGEDFLELVGMLPKLESLHIHNLPHSLHLNQHLHCLDGLTKFSFYSPDNCNQLLIKLTKNSKLMDLQIWMPLDTDTFDIIKSFPSLKVLSMHQFGQNESMPENTVFPLTLKSVKVTGVKMSRKTLISAVKQLQFLDEFDLGYRHDLDKSLHFNEKNVITQMEVELKSELNRRQRPLNIIYYDRRASNKQLYIHKSTKLQIVNAYAARNARNRHQSQRITVALPV